MFGAKAKTTGTAMGRGGGRAALELPVLAISPPSRPHTPAQQQQRLEQQPRPHPHPQPYPDASSSPSSSPHTTPPSPPPGDHTDARGTRARSYSIKNGLLSPEPPCPASSSSCSSPSTSLVRPVLLHDEEYPDWWESPTESSFQDTPLAGSSSNAPGSSQTPGMNPNITVYHIYHSGKALASFSVHTSPDTVHKPQPKSTSKPTPASSSFSSPSSPSTPHPPKSGTSFWKPWQETALDPRVPLYFLHQPRIAGHDPCLTLRWGGDGRDYLRPSPGPDTKPIKRKRDMKYAPAICQMSGDSMWRKWELEFTVLVPGEDEQQAPGFKGKSTKDRRNWVYKGLNERGVLDGRGVLAGWYPFKKGMFGWNMWGETGKEWIEKEAARMTAQGKEPSVRRRSTSDLKGIEKVDGVERQEKGAVAEDEDLVLLPPEKIPKHLWPIQLDPVPELTPSSSSSPQSPTARSEPPGKSPNPKKDPPNPSKLTLRWPHIFSREYEFTYLSTNFYWRGTHELNNYLEDRDGGEIKVNKQMVAEARKKKGLDWCAWAHLKLVVCLPKKVVDGWGEEGGGLIGKKRRESGNTGMGENSDIGFGLGLGAVEREGGGGRSMRGSKRRSSSFSSVWSGIPGITRRNTIAGGEGKQDEHHHQQDPPQSQKSLSRRASFLSTFSLSSRPTTPALPPPQIDPLRQYSPSPSRSSTWGTSTSASASTSTIVPWQSNRSSTSLLLRSDTATNGKRNETPSQAEEEEMSEIVLARYTCVVSARKAGRLLIEEDALAKVAEWVFGAAGERVRYINPPLSGMGMGGTGDIEGEGEGGGGIERLRHVIVATSLCMVMTEKEKRDRLRDVAFLAAEGGGAAAN